MVLPILVLLLLMAVDFGRVFFGFVALQNAARIGADRAAQTASAWPTANTGEEVNWRAEYQLFIENDIQAANCAYTTPHPDPVFRDMDGDGDATSFGDLATVTLNCEFGLLTPLAENIFGGPIALSGSSTFSVHGMIVAGVPDPPPPPPEPCADPVATFTTNPAANAAGGSRIDDLDPLTGSPASPFLVTFTASAAGTAECPITYAWTFPGTTPGAAATATVVDHPFTDAAGNPSFTEYTVTLTVTGFEGATDVESIKVRASNP